jgi:hypothetical protein
MPSGGAIGHSATSPAEYSVRSVLPGQRMRPHLLEDYGKMLQ